MPDRQNTDPTLPAVVASLRRDSQEQALLLTIVFHPDPNRIGETARFDKLAGENSRILGRQSPSFEAVGSDQPARALDDPYLSREAVQARYSKGSITLSRSVSASRCQIEGCELSGEVLLSRERLSEGVPILLSGRIVLLLRRVPRYPAKPIVALPGQALQGNSAYMCDLRAQISRLAKADVDVLIRGETGTGKELVAAAVHAASARAGEKLITVNMAAIPAALAPAALFGTARGAFTGADGATVGYFEQAQGGTLFLDEIGDIPTEIQAQLLRVLQQREVQCVGGPIRTVDLRVISATDASLEAQACNFKAALRHRLAEAEIKLLPLRLHPEDTGELLWLFLNKNMHAMSHGDVLPGDNSGADTIALWAELFHRFVCYDWPGNIRELSNFAHQVALASEAEVTIPHTVLGWFHKSSPVDDIVADEPLLVDMRHYSDEEFLSSFTQADFEVARVARQLVVSRQAVYRRIAETPGLCLASEYPLDQILRTLEKCNGDVTVAARQLRISRAGLRERIRNTPKVSTG